MPRNAMPFAAPHRGARPAYTVRSRWEVSRSRPLSAREVVTYVVPQSATKSPRPTNVFSPLNPAPSEIGRASCRERVRIAAETARRKQKRGAETRETEERLHEH